MDSRNSCFQNAQKHQTKQHKLKVELVHNSYRGEDEATKMMDSIEFSLNKRDDDDIFSEERVSRNLYAVINHLEK